MNLTATEANMLGLVSIAETPRNNARRLAGRPDKTALLYWGLSEYTRIVCSTERLDFVDLTNDIRISSST